VDDGQIDLAAGDYLMPGTLESYQQLKAYFGEQALVPVYVEVEDGERLIRAIRREQEEQKPRYAEVCRRFLADAEDFSEEKLRDAGIVKRYNNDDFERCLQEILEDIVRE
jgi:guanylate kinase